MSQRCPDCGTGWTAQVKLCAGCGRLVHAAELGRLAEQARAAKERGDGAAELASWRSALALLPPGIGQTARVESRIAALTAKHGEPSPAPSWLASFGALGALAWKAKSLVVVLGSWQTALSMFVAFGVYWTAWGWPFALGLVVSIYVHEMGHVVALRRAGIAASAPMFVPGLGAFVRLRHPPATAHDDAVVGLAGPWAGLAIALAAYALGAIVEIPILLAIAKVGAQINLFNLLPIWQLDGGRAFRALSRGQRAWAALAVGLVSLLAGEMLLFVLGAVALARASFGQAPAKGDRSILAQYAALIAAHAALGSLHVPAP